MKTNRAGLLLIVFALLALAACSQSAPQATPPATVVASTAVPATAVAATPQPAASPLPVSTSPAADNWDDRAIFRAGLIKDEQAALDQLPGASVYHLDVELAADLAALQGQPRPRVIEQQARSGLHQPIGQGGDPFDQRGRLTAHQRRFGLVRDQLCRSIEILCGQSMIDRCDPQVVLLTPGAGAAMKLFHFRRSRLAQPPLQQIGKQAMMAVRCPAA